MIKRSSKAKYALIGGALSIGLAASMGTVGIASISDEGFKVRSYNTANPAIEGTAGLRLQNNGGNENPTTPETGESCGWDNLIILEDATAFNPYPDSRSLLIPGKMKENGYESDEYNWIYEVYSLNGTITVGDPKVSVLMYIDGGDEMIDITKYPGVKPLFPRAKVVKADSLKSDYPDIESDVISLGKEAEDNLRQGERGGLLSQNEKLQNEFPDSHIRSVHLEHELTVTYPASNGRPCQTKTVPMKSHYDVEVR